MESEFSSKDILCGRGGKTNTHCGNRVFRRIVNARKGLYRKYANDKRLKYLLVKSIYLATRKSGMRFINQSSLEEIEEKEAMEKVAQALRDARIRSGTKHESTRPSASSSYLLRHNEETSCVQYKEIYDAKKRRNGARAGTVSARRGKARSSSQHMRMHDPTPKGSCSCVLGSPPVEGSYQEALSDEVLSFSEDAGNLRLAGNLTRILNVLSVDEENASEDEEAWIPQPFAMPPDSIQSNTVFGSPHERVEQNYQLQPNDQMQSLRGNVATSPERTNNTIFYRDDCCCEDEFKTCFDSYSSKEEDTESSCPIEQRVGCSSTLQQERFDLGSIQNMLARLQKQIEEQERAAKPLVSVTRYPSTSLPSEELSNCWDPSVEEELCYM